VKSKPGAIQKLQLLQIVLSAILQSMLSSIIFIMGVSGSGKTTIGKKLSSETGVPFFDADDFHTEANKDKMKAGIPLTDDDRQDWLLQLNLLAKKERVNKGAIIACSALKEKYRQQLSAGIHSNVDWVFLQGSPKLISKRIKARSDHFMQPALLQSQFDILEIPAQAIFANIENDPDSIVKQIIDQLSGSARF
jgi:carbohydrate kinase (thermoresistant glucokinase family)